MAVTITTTTLPYGVVGRAYAAQLAATGGVTPYTFSLNTGSPALPAGISLAGSGALSGTPTEAGAPAVVFKVTDSTGGTPLTDTQTITLTVYAALAIDAETGSGSYTSPSTEATLNIGEQFIFAATGGSGAENFRWSTTGGNLINSTSGLFTATTPGNHSVILTDYATGETHSIDVIVTSQDQFCTVAEVIQSESKSREEACCEFRVESGQAIQLRVPSFHALENGEKVEVDYDTPINGSIGDAAAFQSTASDGLVFGNVFNTSDDFAYEIVTNTQMGTTGNGEYNIGFSFEGNTTSTPDIYAKWYDSGSDRMVAVFVGEDAEADSGVEVNPGDVVTFGKYGNEIRMYVNSVQRHDFVPEAYTSPTMRLVANIELANRKLGGYLENLAWSITTSGSASEVGTVDANGVYRAPLYVQFSTVVAVATLGTNAHFRVILRNVMPSPRYQQAQAFLNGRAAQVWVTNRKATDNEPPRLAADGSPDAVQNPGMIYLGILKAEATFAEEITYQDYENDEGVYSSSIASERGTLTGTFLEVRDLDKLALMMQHATVHNTRKGVKEFSVGGKQSGGCDLRAMVIVDIPGGGWDVLYIPKAQNQGNLSLAMGRKAETSYAFSLRALPDQTRPLGKQLYSIYQLESCDTSSDTLATCN